jgi:hypothetical protein
MRDVVLEAFRERLRPLVTEAWNEDTPSWRLRQISREAKQLSKAMTEAHRAKLLDA